MPFPAFRHGAAALLFCALPLLGCGAGATGGGGGGPTAAASAGGRERFEGRYEGRRFPQDTAAGPNACRGQARAVRFEVGNGIIEMRSVRPARTKRKADLWGAVSADGQVTMRPPSGKRMVVGRIEGDRLTATDTQEPQALAQDALQSGRTPCQYRYEATRGAGPSGSAAGRGGDVAAGAPPGERFPQP